jgi:drug/metabolite transporter (DMT)-like permease
MYPYILGIILLKSCIPYLKKHLLISLTSFELIYLNTFIIFILTLIIFLYKYIFHTHIIHNIFESYKKLTITQILAVSFISLSIIISSFFNNEFDKYFNTPLINSIFKKIISIIILVLIGVFLFEEKYNWKQITGIVLSIIGVYLLFQKDKEKVNKQVKK